MGRGLKPALAGLVGLIAAVRLAGRVGLVEPVEEMWYWGAVCSASADEVRGPGQQVIGRGLKSALAGLVGLAGLAGVVGLVGLVEPLDVFDLMVSPVALLNPRIRAIIPLDEHLSNIEPSEGKPRLYRQRYPFRRDWSLRCHRQSPSVLLQ